MPKFPGGMPDQRRAQVRLELAAAAGLDVRQVWQGHTANWRRRHPGWLADRMCEALWRGDPAPVVTRLVAIFGIEGAESVIGTAGTLGPGPPGRIELTAALAGLPAPGMPWGSPWGSPWRRSALWRRLEAVLASRWRPPSGDLASETNRAEAACLIAGARLGPPQSLAMAQTLDGGERTRRRRLAELLVGPPRPQ
jgi:hypothetical protein